MVSIGLDDPISAPPEEEDNTEVINTDYNAPITAMVSGLRCTVSGCVYNTDSQLPKDADLLLKIQFLRLHTDNVHSVGADDHDYDQHGVEVNAEVVHVDSDALTMVKQMDQGWNTSPGRSKKSKKRNKSRRYNMESSDKGWSVLC